MFLTGVTVCRQCSAWVLHTSFQTPTQTAGNTRTPLSHPPTRPAWNKAASPCLLWVSLSLNVAIRHGFSFLFFSPSPSSSSVILFSSCATLLADQLREKLCVSLCLLMADGVKLNKWAGAQVVTGGLCCVITFSSKHTRTHALAWMLCTITFIRCCLTPV